MTSTAIATAPPNPSEFGYFVRLYAKEAKYEFLKLLRYRMFSISTIGFPVMFYLLFGVTNRHAVSGGVHYARYLLASYSCFGMIGSALFGIGVGLANERAQGWLEVKQASPMPAPAYLFAKLFTATAFAMVTTTILVILAITLGGVQVTLGEVLRLVAVVAAGSIPFASMGLLIALVVTANAAPGVVNLIYLPMSFCSGLWMPIEVLPKWLQQVAPALPTYHFAQLALGIFGYSQSPRVLGHWVALIGFTVLMLGISWMVFRHQESNA